MSALGLQEDQLLELLLHLKVTILHQLFIPTYANNDNVAENDT